MDRPKIPAFGLALVLCLGFALLIWIPGRARGIELIIPAPQPVSDVIGEVNQPQETPAASIPLVVVALNGDRLGVDVDSSVYLPLIVRDGVSPPSPTPTPTATPTPTPTPTPTQVADWLSYVNQMRALGSLPVLGEVATWSDGCWYHARYVVKNDEIGHSEDPANDWYTPQGDEAAQNSNVYASTSVAQSDEAAIDAWLAGPFHGIGILDPALLLTGFGSYREAMGYFQMSACLNVLNGLGSIPPTVSFPILWPGDGTMMPLLKYGGGESPDPLASCPGYVKPSGPPIYLQVGAGELTPSVSAHAFTQGGEALEHCVYDETSYVNADPALQSLGRSILNPRDAIVLIPRNPLVPGSTYSVSITTNGQTYSWSFTAGGAAQALGSSPEGVLP